MAPRPLKPTRNTREALDGLLNMPGSLPIAVPRKGTVVHGPMVNLPPLPKELRADFNQVLSWHNDLVDDALARVRNTTQCKLGRHNKGKGRLLELSPTLKKHMGRLAFALTPRDAWNIELPFYVGALQFVINAHGPLGLNLVEDAAFFLRLPMEPEERTKTLFSIGLMPPETIMAMRPLMQFCIDHGVTGAALLDIFERLGTSQDALSLSRRMLDAVRAPGRQLLTTLEPRVLELWLYIATELPHETQDDVPWAAFAGRAMLSHLMARARSGTATAQSLDIDMNLLRNTMAFSSEHRIATLDLLLPLAERGEMPYGIAATVLQLFALHGEHVRAEAQAWLQQTSFRAVNPQHLLLGVLLASRQAFYKVYARKKEPKA